MITTIANDYHNNNNVIFITIITVIVFMTFIVIISITIIMTITTTTNTTTNISSASVHQRKAGDLAYDRNFLLNRLMYWSGELQLCCTAPLRHDAALDEINSNIIGRLHNELTGIQSGPGGGELNCQLLTAIPIALV